MTTEPSEREEAPEPTWCANCGNRVYQSGGKWFHLSTGGMPCNIPAHAIPSSEYAATRMRERCVGAVKAALADEQRKWRDGKAINQYELGQRAAFTYALAAIESLTLDEKGKPPTHA